MIGRLELRRLVAERSARWILLVLGAVACLAGALGGARTQRAALQQREAQEDVEKQRQELLESLRKFEANPEPVEEFWQHPGAPTRVTRRLRPLVSLSQSASAAGAVGLSALHAQRLQVSPFKTEPLAQRPLQSPLALWAGELDLSFVVITLAPLAALALCFQLVAGEREQGTWALALAQVADPRNWLLWRLAWRGLLVWGAVVLGGALGLLLGGVSVWSLDWLAWAVIAALYTSVWLGLCLVVNALGRGTAWTSLTLLGAWLGLVFLFPAVLRLTTEALAPVPSGVELVGEQRRATDDAERRQKDLLQRFYIEHPEYAARDQEDEALNAGIASQRAAQDAVAPLLQRRAEALMQRRTWQERLGILSPAISTQSLLLGLAGTGEEAYGALGAAAQEKARFWEDELQRRVFLGAKGRFRAEEIEKIPSLLQIVPPSPGPWQWLGWAFSLLGMTIGLFWLGLRWVRRLDHAR